MVADILSDYYLSLKGSEKENHTKENLSFLYILSVICLTANYPIMREMRL